MSPVVVIRSERRLRRFLIGYKMTMDETAGWICQRCGKIFWLKPAMFVEEDE